MRRFSRNLRKPDYRNQAKAVQTNSRAAVEVERVRKWHRMIYILDLDMELGYYWRMKPNISANDLRRAADIKDKIESLQSELEKTLGAEVQNGVQGSNAKPSRRGRRKMSAAAKSKIAAAQRARWAKWKAARK